MRPRCSGVSALSARCLPSVGIITGGCSSHTRSATLSFHFGKLLVEVGQDHGAAGRVVLVDGDADGFEIKAILAVVLLGEVEDQRLGLGRVRVAHQQQGFPTNLRPTGLSARLPSTESV